MGYLFTGAVSVLLLMTGCSSSSSNYMLTAPTTGKRELKKQLPIVGVEKITLPEYMKRGKVAVQLSPTRIHYSASDEWLEDMEESLTRQLIFTLQKSFRHPAVYSYPWGLSKPAGLRIKVSISRFIAYGNTVYLEANWKITDTRKEKVYSRLFSTKVPCKREIPSVVAAMNKAFGKMSYAIVDDINRKF